MKYTIFIFLILLTCFRLTAQTSKKFSLEINYGLNGNFFVRSYDELSGPQNAAQLFKKNFMGTVGGMELKFHINHYSSLFGGYARSSNKGEKNYTGNINNVTVFVNDFNIRHINDFFLLGYERRFKKSNPRLTYHVGFVLVRMQQQEISIENSFNQILIDERNFKNSGLEEAGIFWGLHFKKMIDTKFELGIKIRAYYLISAQTFEALTLTPTLAYIF